MSYNLFLLALTHQQSQKAVGTMPLHLAFTSFLRQGMRDFVLDKQIVTEVTKK